VMECDGCTKWNKEVSHEDVVMLVCCCISAHLWAHNGGRIMVDT